MTKLWLLLLLLLLERNQIDGGRCTGKERTSERQGSVCGAGGPPAGRS